MSENRTGTRPTYYGKIQDGLRNEIGKIAVWDNTEPTSEKSPVLEGKIEVDGVRYKVALWKNKEE
jgi:hypothetical protein